MVQLLLLDLLQMLLLEELNRLHLVPVDNVLLGRRPLGRLLRASKLLLPLVILIWQGANLVHLALRNLLDGGLLGRRLLGGGRVLLRRDLMMKMINSIRPGLLLNIQHGLLARLLHALIQLLRLLRGG